jgi:ketosteroid isomerase-like protein
MIRRIFLLSVVVTLPLLAHQPDEADHKALGEIRVLYERAVNEDRLDLLEPYFAKPFYGVMITSKRVSTLDEMKQYWASIKNLMGPGGTYHVSVEAEKAVIMGDFALARGTTSDTVKTGAGKTYQFGTNWTATLHKEGGTWKVLQVQGSMDPVGNPFVKVFAYEAMKRAGIAAGLAGLVLGLLIGWLIARRR